MKTDHTLPKLDTTHAEGTSPATLPAMYFDAKTVDRLSRDIAAKRAMVAVLIAAISVNRYE